MTIEDWIKAASVEQQGHPITPRQEYEFRGYFKLLKDEIVWFDVMYVPNPATPGAKNLGRVVGLIPVSSREVGGFNEDGTEVIHSTPLSKGDSPEPKSPQK